MSCYYSSHYYPYHGYSYYNHYNYYRPYGYYSYHSPSYTRTETPYSSTTTYHSPARSETTTTYHHSPYHYSYYRPYYSRWYDNGYCGNWSSTYAWNNCCSPYEEVVEEEYLTPSRKRTVTKNYHNGTTRVTYTSP